MIDKLAISLVKEAIDGRDEQIAQLQYEAGMYQSLYENALRAIEELRAALEQQKQK